jgi:hypothetical protein
MYTSFRVEFSSVLLYFFVRSPIVQPRGKIILCSNSSGLLKEENTNSQCGWKWITKATLILIKTGTCSARIYWTSFVKSNSYLRYLYFDTSGAAVLCSEQSLFSSNFKHLNNFLYCVIFLTYFTKF